MFQTMFSVMKASWQVLFGGMAGQTESRISFACAILVRHAHFA